MKHVSVASTHEYHVTIALPQDHDMIHGAD